MKTWHALLLLALLWIPPVFFLISRKGQPLHMTKVGEFSKKYFLSPIFVVVALLALACGVAFIAGGSGYFNNVFTPNSESCISWDAYGCTEYSD